MLVRQKSTVVLTWRRLLVAGVGAALAIIATAAADAIAASVASADLKVQSMTATSTWVGDGTVVTHTVLVVQNDNDDDARNVQLIVTLPPTSHITSSQPTPLSYSTVPDPSTPWPVTGSATFSLGTLPVNGTATVSIWSQMLQVAVTPNTSVGAFVFDSLPDPVGANNFRSALVKATGG